MVICCTCLREKIYIFIFTFSNVLHYSFNSYIDARSLAVEEINNNLSDFHFKFIYYKSMISQNFLMMLWIFMFFNMRLQLKLFAAKVFQSRTSLEFCQIVGNCIIASHFWASQLSTSIRGRYKGNFSNTYLSFLVAKVRLASI